MSTARTEILDRVRHALADRAAAPEVTRDYRGAGELVVAEPVALLTERLLDYRAGVRRCRTDEIAAVIAQLLVDRGITSVVVPDGVPPSWLDPSVVRIMSDEPPRTAEQLDTVDGVITTCACAIALTGTIVLDAGPGQGRRALTLVPDYHLVVVPSRADRRRRPGCRRCAGSHPTTHLDQRTQRDQRHRTATGRGRARSPRARRAHRRLAAGGA